MADSNDGNSMIAVVMMVMMIVLVIMIIVLKALRRVDLVLNHSRQMFHNITDCHRAKVSCGKPNPSQSMHLSGTAPK
jgi:hypothetical protein